MADSCGGTLPEGQMASTLARETNNNKDNEAGDPHNQVPNTCDDVIVGLSDVDFGSGSDQVDVNPTSSRGRKRSRSRTSDSDESDDRDSVRRDRYHSKRKQPYHDASSPESSSDTNSSDDNSSGSDKDQSDFNYGDHTDSDDQDDGPNRFYPLAKSTKHKWHVSSGQQKIVGKHFSQYLGESVVNKTIKKHNPRQTQDALESPRLDESMIALLPSAAKSPCTLVDGSFRRVQNKVLDVMGPLGKIWAKLETIKRGSKKSYNADKMLKWVQQAVILMGQANVVINHTKVLFNVVFMWAK